MPGRRRQGGYSAPGDEYHEKSPQSLCTQYCIRFFTLPDRVDHCQNIPAPLWRQLSCLGRLHRFFSVCPAPGIFVLSYCHQEIRDVQVQIPAFDSDFIAVI
jgi:hypothetical protein